MNDQLTIIENKFQQHLRDGDYTFIGPSDSTQFQQFFQAVNLRAPVIAISRTIHHALTNKEAVKYVNSTYFNDQELRIYVVIGSIPYALAHATIEEYCKRNNIIFNPAT